MFRRFSKTAYNVSFFTPQRRRNFGIFLIVASSSPPSISFSHLQRYKVPPYDPYRQPLYIITTSLHLKKKNAFVDLRYRCRPPLPSPHPKKQQLAAPSITIRIGRRGRGDGRRGIQLYVLFKYLPDFASIGRPMHHEHRRFE